MTRSEARAAADALLVAHGALEPKRAARMVERERADGTLGFCLTFERIRPRKAHAPREQRPPREARTQSRAERRAQSILAEHEATKAERNRKRLLAQAGLLGFAG